MLPGNYIPLIRDRKGTLFASWQRHWVKSSTVWQQPDAVLHNGGPAACKCPQSSFWWPAAHTHTESSEPSPKGLNMDHAGKCEELFSLNSSTFQARHIKLTCLYTCHVSPHFWTDLRLQSTLSHQSNLWYAYKSDKPKPRPFIWTDLTMNHHFKMAQWQEQCFGLCR